MPLVRDRKRICSPAHTAPRCMTDLTGFADTLTKSAVESALEFAVDVSKIWELHKTSTHFSHYETSMC